MRSSQGQRAPGPIAMRSVWQVGGRATSPQRAWGTPQLGASRALAPTIFETTELEVGTWRSVMGDSIKTSYEKGEQLISMCLPMRAAPHCTTHYGQIKNA